MEAHIERVVLIGPEASGKTTLAAELAAAFGARWVPEAARLFAESYEAPLSIDTVAPIARLSMRLEDEAIAAIGREVAGGTVDDAAGTGAPPLLFRDTDLVSTVVYSRHYYGTVEDWIVAESRARRGALYLLCRPDLPWLADGVRDRPMHRERLFAQFRSELELMGARVTEISGAGEARRIMARAAVEHLLSR